MYNEASRAPHGARGLKPHHLEERYAGKNSRAPHGARGLKLHDGTENPCDVIVAPRTGRVD